VVGSLFDEPGGLERDALPEKLRALTREDIYIGGSSWKYEGWLGQIYSRERFSRQAFEREAYANTPKRFRLSAAISLSISSPRKTSIPQDATRSQHKLPTKAQRSAHRTTLPVQSLRRSRSPQGTCAHRRQRCGKQFARAMA
jgi:hypothetical protein